MTTTILNPSPIPTLQPKVEASSATGSPNNPIKIAVFVLAATLLFVLLSMLSYLCVFYHKRYRRPRPSTNIQLSNFAPRPSSTATGNTLPLYTPRDLSIGIPDGSTDLQRPPSYATEHSGVKAVTSPSAPSRGFSMALEPTPELDGPFSDVPLSPVVPEASITHVNGGIGRVPLENLTSLPWSKTN